MIREFTYHRCHTVSDALLFLKEYRGEAKLLAGGQSLLIPMKQRLVNPAHVIDIKGISELGYIRENGQGIAIGALTTHRSIEKSDIINRRFGLLAQAERELGVIQIRNWGTIGGNLCHGDPASDLAAPLIAIDAKAKIVGPRGERIVPLANFFVDYLETVVQEDEMLTEVIVPYLPSTTRTAFSKFKRRHGDMAVCNVAVALDMDGRRCRAAKVVVGAVSSKPVRISASEKVLEGNELTDAVIAEAAAAAGEQVEPVADLNGSEWFKRQITTAMVKRALVEAIG